MIDAYETMTVVGWKPTVPPNPRCCSDVRTLCANCAAEAFRAAPHTRNQLVLNTQQDDLLVPPTLNVDQEEPCVNCDDDSPLLPPEMTFPRKPNYAGASAASFGRGDDDDLLLPPG
jgi:hypothetical protein